MLANIKMIVMKNADKYHNYCYEVSNKNCHFLTHFKFK